jgi:hypothetical protein
MPPSFPAKPLVTRRNKVLKALVDTIKVFRVQKKNTLSAPVAEAAVQEVCRLLTGSLPDRESSKDLIRQAIRRYVGVQMDKRKRAMLAAELAGNWDSIKKGVPWKSWLQEEDMANIKARWTCFTVTNIQRRLTVKSEMYTIELESWFGVWAGYRMRLVWPRYKLTELGLLAVGKKRFHEGLDPYTCSGCLFSGAFNVVNNVPGILKAYTTSGQVAYNRKLNAGRQKVCSLKECSRRKEKKKCNNCNYGRDMCTYARHEWTFKEKEHCAVHTQSIPRHSGFRPDWSEGVCHACLIHGKIPLPVLRKDHLKDGSEEAERAARAEQRRKLHRPFRGKFRRAGREHGG